ADTRCDRQNGSERDHVAVLVANLWIEDVARVHAKARLRLHVDLEDAAELIELVDVARAEITRERREHLVGGQQQRLHLLAVESELVLRRAGTERRRDTLNARLRAGGPHHGIRRIPQLYEIETAVAQFDLHSEAAGIADALYRWRRQHEDAAVLDNGEFFIESFEKRSKVLAFAAKAPILQHDIADTGIGE